MQTEKELKETPVVPIDESLIWDKAKRGEYWGEDGAITYAKDRLNLGRWSDGNADAFYQMARLYYFATRSAKARWEANLLNLLYMLRYWFVRHDAKQSLDMWWAKVAPSNQEATPEELCLRAQILSLHGDHIGAVDAVIKALRCKDISQDVEAMLFLTLAEAQAELRDDSAVFTFQKAHGLAERSGEEVQVRVASSYAYFLVRYGHGREDKDMASRLVHQAWEKAASNGLADEVQKLKPIFRWLGL